jgi:hypothetical protein
MLPDLPTLKRDIQKLISQYLRTQVNSRLGVFSEAQKHMIQEGNRVQILRADGSVDETEMKEVSATMEIPFKEIPHLTVKDQMVKLDEIADQMAGQMSTHLFGTLNEVLDKAGQVTDQKGKPLDAEAVFSVLEKIQIEFDKTGTHHQLSMVVPPALAPKAEKVFQEIQSDPMLRKRHEEIMTRKWMEWRDREASRKLVG